MTITAKKATAIIGALSVLLGLCVFLYKSLLESEAKFIIPSDDMLVVSGKQIYANYCASCHGESLQGQPHWRHRLSNGRLPAPPHDKSGHTWHHPDSMLFDIVKNGLVPGKTAPPRYESDMPAFNGILTDEEIVAVIAYIKNSWPPEVLHAQKEITLQYKSRR